MRSVYPSFISITLALALTFSGLKSQNITPPTPPTRVFYSVFVQSFRDSNGDGIGDINGLTSRLDYLSDLGVEGLWLLPVHPSPTYHKYDVSDYYSIHPDYGTLDDYRNFIRKAHDKGMVVLLDLVINHTSNRISWFREASANPQGKYRNFYVWSNKSSDFESEPFHWHQVRNDQGVKLEGPRYYGFFWWEMPDLNYNNPEVRKEMIRIAEFWLKDVGVDGFRIDAAKFVYPENQQYKSIAWWDEFGQAVRKIKKDAMIVGEVWGPAREAAPYVRQGMSACFNFQLSDSIRASLRGETDHYTLQTWWQTRDIYRIEKKDYEDAIFLTNHDMDRIMTELGGKTEKGKLAATLLLTLPGNPFIYYGEEIGMLGQKPDEFIREPFLWDVEGSDPGQTRWEIPYCSTSGTVKPLKFQQNDPGSLYQFYRKLIHCRNGSVALRQGTFEPLIQPNRKVIGFYRALEGDRKFIVMNLSGSLQKIEAPADIRDYRPVVSTHEIFKQGGNVIYLQPYSAFVLSKQ